MPHRRRLPASSLVLLASAVACSSSSTSAAPDAGASHDAAAPHDAAHPTDATDASHPADAGHPKPDAATAPDAASDADAGTPPPASVSFPSTFLWGSATAGFQVESGDDNTDWSAWVAMSGKIKNGDNPDVGGPDALNHITEDVADLVATHATAYRFGIEWGRLYPTLDDFTNDTPDTAAIASYSALLTALVAAHITPVVTLNHYTLPDWLDDVTQPTQPQGWENADTTTYFVEFCSRVAARWGAQVDYWLTENEPMVLAVGGYLQGSIPPGVLFDIDRTVTVIKAEALAHTQAYDAIHAADTVDADGDGKAALVSIAKHQRTFHPKDPTSAADIAATKHVEYLWNQWFFNVIVLGNWDDDFDGNYTGPNDKMNDPTLKGRADFLGINYYSDTLISAKSGIVIPAPVNASIEQANLGTGRPETDVGWDIYAEGLGTVVDEAKMWAPPIFITENGIADSLDTNRPRFLFDHLFQLGWAMQRGANVIGYLHWASVDNFEWASGFCPNYGLYSFDHMTEVRTARPSATEYAGIIQAGTVTLAQLNAAAPYMTPTTMCP
jgi:beta-glucosidase/6-phospho-beta-glucosidase/beta-galactosidase